jgi:hypothetical protein
MRYHYVMTLTSVTPGGLQRIGTHTDTIEADETNPRKDIFWDAFEAACKRIGMAPDAASVMFWSLEPDRLG